MWDYAHSGASLGFSFDGIPSWHSYSDSQTFAINSSTPIDYKKLYRANNSFWLSHLEKNKDSLLNTKNYEPKALILIPNEKMYLLKFWSRCYLRFCEKFHSYNNQEATTSKVDLPTVKKINSSSNIAISHRPAPPPPTPSLQTPAKTPVIAPKTTPTHIPKSHPAPLPPPQQLQSIIKQSASKTSINASTQVTTSISSSGLKITTKISDEGHITTSF